MARIELSEEFRSIEQIIEAGDRDKASAELDGLADSLRRRPEYRYLRLLFEATFLLRPDAALVQETRDLVAEQPDLAEATALLALLFSRVGDQPRADLFAREALISPSPSAQLRASQVLGLRTTPAPRSRWTGSPVGSAPVRSLTPAHQGAPASFAPAQNPFFLHEPAPASTAVAAPTAPSAEVSSVRSDPGPPTLRTRGSSGALRRPVVPSARLSTPMPGRLAAAVSAVATSLASAAPADPAGGGAPASATVPTTGALEPWFERVRRERVHRRHPTYGARGEPSRLDLLLSAGRAVALGRSTLSPSPIALSRDGLAELDCIIAERRRARPPGLAPSAPGSASNVTSLPSREPLTEEIDAAAGFLLVVALRQLDARAIETAADDGFCKVVLLDGAGFRPIVIATSYMQGTGPGLVQAFDRLAARQARPPGSSPGAPPPSSGSMRAARPIGPLGSVMPASVPSAEAARPDELAMTRPDVELATARRLRGPTRPADPPPLDLSAVAAAFADSTLGREIAQESGFDRLTPGRDLALALEAHASRTWDPHGLSPASTTWHPPDAIEELIIAWGALLGETLIAEYGGLWEADPNAPGDPRLFRVICQDRVAAWPLTHVYLRLKNGSRYQLPELISGVGRLL